MGDVIGSKARMHAYWSSLGISTTELAEEIDRWIYDERARKMLKRKIIDNVTYERLAEENDISVRQANTIVKAYEAVLFNHLRDLKNFTK